MRLLINERRQGQKHIIIKEAAQRYYGIVANEAYHQEMEQISESLGIKCPKLITYEQFIAKDYNQGDIAGVIIHEFDELLRKMSKSPVRAITMVKSIEL